MMKTLGYDLTSLLNHIQVGLMIFKFDLPEGKILAVNDYMCRTLGVEEEVFLNCDMKGIQAPCVPEDEPVIESFMQELFASEAHEAEADYRLLRYDDQEPLWFHVRANADKQEDGSYIAWFVYLDITAAKKREEEYNSNVQALLTTNPAIRCAFRLDLSNDVCLEKHGIYDYTKQLMDAATASELLAHIADIIVDQTDADTFRKDFSRNALLEAYDKGRRQFAITYRRLTESGKTLWVKTFFRLMCDPNSGAIEAIAYTEDYETEHLEESIVANISGHDYEAIGTVDIATHHVAYYFFNGKDARGLRDVEGPFEQRAEVLYEQSESEAEKCHIRDQLSVGRIVRELKYRDKVSVFMHIDGRDEELVYRYLDDSRNRLLFTRRDITLLTKEKEDNEKMIRDALAQAEAANRHKTDFFGNVSHDLRTPLNAILGYNRVLIDRNDVPDDARDYLNKIHRAAETMLMLVDDTLDMQRIEAGDVGLKLVPVWTDEFTESVVTTIAPMVKAKNLTFLRDDTRAVNTLVWADPVRMRQVFVNVLSNAVMYTPEGGTISVMLENLVRDDDHTVDRLIIKDTGIGMSEEFLEEHLFEPFAQERTRDNANLGGSGLGLSIVKRILDQMGCEIHVSSTLGEGTTVTMILNLKRAPEPEEDTTQEQPDYISLEGKHALVIEDNGMNAEIAMMMLEDEGCTVDVAEDGQAGVNRFLSEPEGSYDLILMDLRMPVMDGYEATRTIRQSGRKDAKTIPIIAQSADAYEGDVKKSLEAGMNAHIAKPLDPDTLMRVITGIMMEQE